jgi:tetratricopeptide (TPR) repeat protein
MSPLEPPDSHFLNAATGWLMLGNAVEARAEFTQIRPGWRGHPLVLEFEWRLLAQERRWLEALEAGERLLRVCPEDANAWVHRSYALHELRRTREAFDLLLPAVRRFPQEVIISYNLACYTCQLGDLAAARRWFEQALIIDNGAEAKLHRLRAALEDSDLQALWPEFQRQVADLEGGSDG